MGGLLENRCRPLRTCNSLWPIRAACPRFTPDAWAGLMSGMTEQSKALMNQWQEQFKIFPLGRSRQK